LGWVGWGGEGGRVLVSALLALVSALLVPCY
jgi:hypothetical protein